MIKKVVNRLKSKWLGLLILLILFLFINYNNKTTIFKVKTDDEIILTQSFIKQHFPKMKSSTNSKKLKGWNIIKDSKGRTLGYYIVSENNRWKVTGYNGNVPIFIKLDENQKISGVELLDNIETPRFLYRLYSLNFFKSWNGLTLSEVADSNIDTIAGVTLTSQTVISNLFEVILNTEAINAKRKVDYKKIVIITCQYLLLLFALCSFIIKDLKKYRIWFLVSNILIFGFIAGNFISMAMLKGFLTGAVHFTANPVLWITVLLSVILPLISNKSFYCNYICPFGAAQEIVGKVKIKLKISKQIHKTLNSFRPILFGILTLLILINYSIDLSLIEPFAAFLYSVAAPITVILAVVSLIISVFIDKPWCKWFCPTGQMLEYLRSQS
ncbi:MAG: 4Fe-4S binding protein [Spirochaetaceae bacterium]